MKRRRDITRAATLPSASLLRTRGEKGGAGPQWGRLCTLRSRSKSNASFLSSPPPQLPPFSINDIALKVLALASPIFSTVMSCFIVVYGFLDNHWSDREHEMIDTLGKKSLTNNPVIGDNSL